MINGNNEKIRRILGIFLLSVILSFFGEFLTNIDYDGILFNFDSDYKKMVYHAENLEFHNASLLPEGKVICEFDPQINIENSDCYVYSVELRYHELSSDGLAVQVYYDTGDGFNDDQCIISGITQNSKSLIIAIKEDIKNLRIDIGRDNLDSYYLDRIIINPGIRDYIISGFEQLSVVRWLLYFVIIFICLLFIDDYNNAKELFFKYRWHIGGLTILFATLLKLHGSSIGFLSGIISGFNISGLFGTPRGIRSDEYIVFTEMALSQVKSGFRWFSDSWGYSPSDMFIVYGQPVANLVSIFRPFSFPYIFLGAEYGLAFFWSARLVVLMLVSVEFGRLITEDDRGLSWIYAVLVAFSPVIQWWYSVNGLVEMLIFGQAAVLITALYLKEKNLRRKILYIAGLVISAGGYILTLYPAWMVPFFIVFLICEINVLMDNRGNIHFCVTDIIFVLTGVLTLVMAFVYIYSISGDTINKVMNTVYPGKRIYTGGSLWNIISLFRGWSSWIWTFTELENPCEFIDFISFFPLGILLAAYSLKRKKDRWLISLLVVDAFLITFYLFRLPEIVGKITLLSHSSSRMNNAIGFINLIILLRSLKRAEESPKMAKLLMSVALIGALISLYELEEAKGPEIKFLIIIVAVILAGLVAYQNRLSVRKLFIIVVMIISIVGGAFVNPVSTGLDSIYHTRLVQEIRKISENDGLWVVCSDNPSFSNLPTIVGAHTMSALATYPDFALWEKLGLEKKENIWNRYAHIIVKISNKTGIEKEQADLIKLNITLEDMEKLGVRYILSEAKIASDKVRALYEDERFIIYELGTDEG